MSHWPRNKKNLDTSIVAVSVASSHVAAYCMIVCALGFRKCFINKMIKGHVITCIHVTRHTDSLMLRVQHLILFVVLLSLCPVQGENLNGKQALGLFMHIILRCSFL